MQYLVPTTRNLPCSKVTIHFLSFRFLSWEVLFLPFLSFLVSEEVSTLQGQTTAYSDL